MQLFFTKFAVNNSIEINDFIDIIKTWLTKSPKYNIADINYKGENGLSQFCFGKYTITFLRMISSYNSDDTEICACRFTNNESTHQWNTDIFFEKHKLQAYISIKLSCQTTSFSPELPNWHVPYIIKVLIKNNLCDNSEPIHVSDTPCYLKESDLKLCSDIILKGSNFTLPIIYVSYDPFNSKHYSTDPCELAKCTAGFAHVIVEPSRDFSLNLKKLTNNCNIHNGYIGIYYPKSAHAAIFEPSLYSSKGVINEEALNSDIKNHLINSSIYNVNCESVSWENLQTEYHKANYFRDKNSVDDYINAFSCEVDELKDKLAKATKTIEYQNSEINRLRNKYTTNNAIMLQFKDSEQFYEGEYLDCVLSSLQNEVARTLPDSRKMEVLNDILNNNEMMNVGSKILDQVKTIIKSNGKFRNDELTKLGFTIIPTAKKHPKMYFKTPKYTFTLSNTPSDHSAADNLYSDIAKRISIY